MSLLATITHAQPGPNRGKTRTLSVRDSIGQLRDADADAQQMLDGIGYPPASFHAVCSVEPGPWDALVRFPSPKPSGLAVNDTVVLEWYAAREAGGVVKRGPAMLVLHILSGRMAVARTFAKAFAANGIHAFVMHMPHYGLRRTGDRRPDAAAFVSGSRQAFADARRARDVIAAMPNVQGGRVGIQGTSLGGFVSTVAASIDGAFGPVFITLAGGDIHGVFVNGARDSAKVRSALEEAGYTGGKLKALAWRVEPLRLAHRLNASQTWLFSATDDTVVPPANARKLATKARLPEGHHVWAVGDHYTAALNLPWIIPKMIREVHRLAETGE